MNQRNWRRSAVEAFGCPLRFQRIYIDGIQDAGDEALRGRAFHIVALVYIQRLVAAGVSSDHEEAVKAFREGMSLVQVPDSLREELVQADGREFRPDLVYAHPGELEVYDFKTYFKGLTEIQARKELQPRFYLVEAKRAWPGFQRYRFTFDFVRLGWTLSIVFTADEVDALAAGVQTAIDQVAQAEAVGEFPALPGSHCGLCRLACPVVDNALGMVDARVTTAARAQEVGGQILAMERRLKLLKKALSGFCQIDGPVTVGGEQFSHAATVSARYPAAAAMDVLADHGLSVDRMSVSKTGLGLTAKKMVGRVWDDLAKIATVARRSSFRHKRVGEDIPAGAVDILDDVEREGEFDGPDYES